MGFVIAKRLSYSKERILLSGFLRALHRSADLYICYIKIIIQEDLIKFILWFNFIIILNLFNGFRVLDN